jgi:2-C-methyl-D-erythritol 4-phosphate cytidylyltransferase/2-C-methyl-D-erythritol 2,4-cyclodiphosphate synthase
MPIKSLFVPSREDGRDRIRSLLSASGPLASRAVAILPAAGKGERSGLTVPKQYHRLAGETLLGRSIRAISRHPAIALILVVLSPDDEHWEESGLESSLRDQPPVIALPIGGTSRRESVMAGLSILSESISDQGESPWVLVHDAARPGLSEASLSRLWDEVRAADSGREFFGGILATPIADTVKRSSSMSVSVQSVSQTISREGLWAAQTPQMFRLQDLLTAYQRTPNATDEASAIEACQGQVLLVPGSMTNFKLTQPDDFTLMEAWMSQSQPPSFGIGSGFDVHRLVEGRPLIIGGVQIPFEKGLDGHSDADVLLHAITDAILGAAGMGDIGRHFPDTDPTYRGADSRLLLAEVVRRVAQAGWQVSQIDATVIAQAPKISPYAQAMQQVIASTCEVPITRVNIKGKTTEHLGFTGRGEGIAAQAVAMVVRSS